jgi:hypothetical protein
MFLVFPTGGSAAKVRPSGQCASPAIPLVVFQTKRNSPQTTGIPHEVAALCAINALARKVKHHLEYSDILQAKGESMYAVKLEYQHRTNGPQGRTIQVDTGSMAAAIGKAAREFLKSLDRKERFDANKNGLTIVCTKASEEAAAANA